MSETVDILQGTISELEEREIEEEQRRLERDADIDAAYERYVEARAQERVRRGRARRAALLHRPEPRGEARRLRANRPGLAPHRQARLLRARRISPDRPGGSDSFLAESSQGKDRRMTPRQSPLKRRNPSGKVAWVARYRGPDGRRQVAKPRWNGGKGTFALKSEAQKAIDEALECVYGLGVRQPGTIGNSSETYTDRHPRSPRTNKTDNDRIGYLLDVEVEGRPLRDWRFAELRRRHILDLVDHMLRVQGRAVQGVRNILSAFSVMTERAIDNEVAGANVWKGISLRRNDPRAQKAAKPVLIWSFDQMRALAAGGRPEARASLDPPLPKHDYEALLLTPGLTGLRLGVPGSAARGLRRQDAHGSPHSARGGDRGGDQNRSRRAHGWPGRSLPALPGRGDPGDAYEDRLALALPDSHREAVARAELLSRRLGPGAAGQRDRRDPHHCRHSYVTHLHAAGIDPADLAKVAGHTVETMIGTYTHALERSHDEIRAVIG